MAEKKFKLKITSGKVVVTDPCYLGESIDSEISVANGMYDVYQTKIKIQGLDNGEYVKELVMVKSGENGKALKWMDRGKGINVDSGTAGFFDYDTAMVFFSDRNIEDEIAYWYDDNIVDLDGIESFFDGSAVVSPTAMGDGHYSIEIAKNGKITVGIKLVFVTDKDIIYYNTPTLFLSDDVLVFHSSNLTTPLITFPKAKVKRDSFVKTTAKGVIGVSIFDKEEIVNPASVLATFKIPKEGKLASLFRLSEDKHDISLEKGFIVITTKTLIEKSKAANLGELLQTNGDDKYWLDYIKLDIEKGIYSVATDICNGKIVSIKIGRTD